MQITVKNCNNIENGIINIKEGILNIKYVINGTGKSTISKAIKLGIENKDMTELKPFNSNDNIYPSITEIEQFNKLKIYNETFHIENTYIFQLDPYAYNLIPEYIVDICTSIINRMPLETEVLM